MKKITTFLLALLLTIPAMAHNLAANSKMYFEKPSTWSAAQFMIGHNSWSEGYLMSKISNTNLYYISMVKWDGYTEWIVFGQSSKWGGEGNSITHRANYMGSNKTTIGTSALGTCNLINTNGTFTALSSYSSLNHTQTIDVEGEGTTAISTYKLNGDNTSTTSTGTTSADAAYTATVNCTATAASGYQFVGWYDGSTLLSTNATYSYTAANAAKTITARFEQLAAETPVISNFAASATNVATGDVVTFSCDVENGDEANVVYLVNGKAIVGNEWTPTEAGEYTISATLENALPQTLTVAVYVKPAINAGEKAVFFDNTNSQWEKVCAYVWNSTGNKVAWPGEECQYLGNNMWKYTCSDFEPNLLIFNNNDNGSQTENLNWVNGGVYSTASKTTPSQVILPEGLNIQLTIPTTAYVGDEVTLTSVYTEGYTVKYYVNGVENGETWTPQEAREYTIAANLMNGSEVVASDEVTVTVKEHTVFYAYLLKEGAWETTNIYSFNPELFGSWPGTALSVTETIEGNEYYKVAFNDVTTVNIIFNDNAGNQTANIDNVTATAYYRLTSNTGNPCVHEVSTTPFEGEIVETGVTYNVTVPAGTPACYITGEWDNWGSFTEMTMVDETHYTITIAEATKAMKYKYCASASWDNVEKQADGKSDVQNRTWSETDVVATWKGIAVYYPENILCEQNYYLRPGTAWNNDGVWFAAYFFNKNTDAHTWVKGELFNDNTNGDAKPTVLFYLSKYNVPAAAPARAKAEEDPVYTHVIFVCMNREATEMSFDGQWDQTEDLTYPTESGYKIYEVAEHGVGDGKAVGEWKNYDSVPTGLEAVEADGMVYAGNVVAAEGAIEVYNLSGAVVARGNNRVDLNGLAGGVYVVRCGNDVLKVVR